MSGGDLLGVFLFVGSYNTSEYKTAFYINYFTLSPHWDLENDVSKEEGNN
jgi:hypothetical protein